MRSRSLARGVVAAIVFAVAWPPAPAAAQFNPPGGRKGPPKPTPRAAPARPAQRPPKPPAAAPARPDAAPASPAKPAPAPEKGPNSDALIARYTGVTLAQPGAVFPLQRLAELYRERDGNLDRLLADFEKRAEQSGDGRWNALVALAGLYRQDGQLERAIASYRRAMDEQPKNPVAILALAGLLSERGDKDGARQAYERALPLIKDDAEREQTLRTLLALALDAKGFDEAKRYHRLLVERARGSFFVRAELGRELLNRAEYARAVDEFREVVKAAAGDNRVLAPALRDLGKALVKLGQREEAEKQLRRALAAAGAQAGIRREIYEIIVDAYRAEEKLATLVQELEAQGDGDYDKLRLLGALYEEIGKIDAALKTYQKALAKNPKDVETRLKLVQILQIQGDLEQAITQYEQLIKAAPQNPDFVFQLAEAWLQRGDRKKALEQLQRLEARSAQDEETLAALVNFYERVDEKARALALLQRLTQMGSHDPGHLVELGSRYWQQDDKKKALMTWERIKLVVPDRALALTTVGEVYLEHDLVKEALEALREATKLKPKDPKYKKAYASALERAGAASSSRDYRNRLYDEARKLWEELLAAAGDNAHAAREARQHIVTLWALSGQLGQRVTPLERRLRATPPDLEAGRLLAEVQVKLQRYADAERTLETVIAKAPGDAGSLMQLERVLVQERKLRRAIQILEQLVRADPKRAREAYQRMAQYAAELYQDDEALRYAARAVELGPEDAEGHKKLGEMYRRRQDAARAIQAFRQALSKNDRMFPVYFQLAELLINQGEVDEADKLLRRVLRASPDEELVSQAARLSMQVNLGRGTLESLEKELLPIALANPGKPLYRRLLVEIYGALAFPLVQKAQSGGAAARTAADEALRRIGERAVKPLLDALSDERDVQQRIAIELLGHIENKSAGPALIAFATGNADSELRARAMLAAGALGDPALLARFSEVLAPHGQVVADESDPIVLGAAWSVARMRSPAARPLLVKLLGSDSPSVRALGALGLGLIGDKRSRPELSELARSVEAGPLPRAAAAFALGELGAAGEAETLARLAEAPDPTLRTTAILALARLSAPSAPRAIADALLSQDADVQRAAALAAVVLATKEYRQPATALEVPHGRLSVRGVLDQLKPAGYGADDRARALIEIAPALRSLVPAAVQSSPERARSVVDALAAQNGKSGYAPLTTDLHRADRHLARSAEEAAASIGGAAVDSFVSLSSHPSADVRAEAVAFLASRPEPAARRAVVAAVTDGDDGVQRAALAALTKAGTSDAVAAIVGLLAPSREWPVRVRAAEALGRVARGTQDKSAVQALSRAAQHDDFALVREAALEALSRVGAAAARPLLSRAAAQDPEPRVRKTAQRLAAELK